MTWTDFSEMSPIVDMTLTGFGVAEIRRTSFPFFSGTPDEPFEMTVHWVRETHYSITVHYLFKLYANDGIYYTP